VNRAPSPQSTLLARELVGFDDVVTDLAAHLVGPADDAARVADLGPLGHLGAKVYRPFSMNAPSMERGPAKRVPTFGPDAAPPDAISFDATALGTAVLAALDADPDRPAVHVARVGTFARSSDEVTFVPALAFRGALEGAPPAPMTSAELDVQLARVRGRDFAIADLQALLAPRRSSTEPEDDVLVDLPAGLPNLLRAALARSSELGNDDRFGFLTPMHREWAWKDFAKAGAGSVPDVFLFSNAPDRVWAMRLAELGEPDPEVTWCDDHASFASSPDRVRLSTWIQLFAFETVLGPLDREGAHRVREAVLRACPDLAPTRLTFPDRFVGPRPDPWLQRVVLTW